MRLVNNTLFSHRAYKHSQSFWEKTDEQFVLRVLHSRANHMTDDNQSQHGLLVLLNIFEHACGITVYVVLDTKTVQHTCIEIHQWCFARILDMPTRI